MDDVFEVLRKLNLYVQGVRLIPVGFKTKLNTLFDLAVVNKMDSCCVISFIDVK